MKYKHIKSVAHNVGHSFLSDMNAAMLNGRYTIVPQLLFAEAAQRQAPRVVIDLLKGGLDPSELGSPIVHEAVIHYGRELTRLAEAQQVDVQSIRSAIIAIEFDYTRERRAPNTPEARSQQFRCTVEILDDRGILHVGQPTNWWFE